MSTIVIVGQSPAVPAAIAALREDGMERRILLVTADSDLPFDRALLPRFLARRAAEKDLLCAPEEWYRGQGVELLRDREIVRLNANRRKLFFDDKSAIDYDALIITDAPQVRLPDIKGTRKQGVFHLVRLSQARRLLKYISVADVIAVAPVSWRGVETALALRAGGRDIMLVGPGAACLPDSVPGPVQEELALRLTAAGLRLFPGNSVEDVLGDAEVRALRLKSGKVVACDMVVLEGVFPDMRLWADGGLLVQARICVHTNMRANVPTVYAMDAMAESLAPSCVGDYGCSAERAREQGRCAALNILGRDAAMVPGAEDAVPDISWAFSEQQVPA